MLQYDDFDTAGAATTDWYPAKLGDHERDVFYFILDDVLWCSWKQFQLLYIYALSWNANWCIEADKNCHHFADGILKFISLNEKFELWKKIHWNMFLNV